MKFQVKCSNAIRQSGTLPTTSDGITLARPCICIKHGVLCLINYYFWPNGQETQTSSTAIILKWSRSNAGQAALPHQGTSGGPPGQPWRESPTENDTHVLEEGPSMDLHLTAVFSLTQSQIQSQGSLPLKKSPMYFLKPSDGEDEMESGRNWREASCPAQILKVKVKCVVYDDQAPCSPGVLGRASLLTSSTYSGIYHPQNKIPLLQHSHSSSALSLII